MIDFSLTAQQADLRERVTHFVREHVIPRENDPRQTPHGPSDELRRELVALAREQGLLSPHAPAEYGGLGLDHRGMAVFFEAAGYSLLGPLAFNIQAPDEGNTNLLHKVANAEQKQRWLRPLVAGEIRTVFSMTEPDDGAGADPSLLKTTARADWQRSLRDQRPQVADHRRAGCGVEHRDGAHDRRGGCRRRRDDVPGADRRAGLRARARARHHRRGVAGRPRGGRFSRRARARQRGARRDRPRAFATPRCGSARRG